MGFWESPDHSQLRPSLSQKHCLIQVYVQGQSTPNDWMLGIESQTPYLVSTLYLDNSTASSQSQHSCRQLSPLWQLHSSTSSFAQVCFPHSLFGLDPKSAPTPSWTPCIQISVSPGLVFQGTKPEITAITCLFRCSRLRNSQSPKAFSIISASKPLKYKRTKWW